MSAVIGKCNKIRHIVCLRQMLRRWRKNASMSSCDQGRRMMIPSDVPAGHVAVSVGSGSRRFVVRATHLNHPIFKKLLSEAADEYGFTNNGLLAIPCDESAFEEILRLVAHSESSKSARLAGIKRCCHVDYSSSVADHVMSESRPLLHGLV